MFAFPRFAGALAVAAGLMSASTSQAFGPVTAAGTASTHTGVAAELHKAHELLVKADHDYDGHRAKAAHEIHEALKAMSGSQHKTGTTATTGQKTGATTTAKATTGQKATGAAAGGKGKMSQEESDKYLKEASKILSQAMAKMPSGHKAVPKVQEAIKEIGVALAKK